MKTRCKFCGRPAEFWSGKTCDVCDRDSDGVNDRDEPIGSDATPLHPIFDVPSKGFIVTQSRKEKKLPTDLPLSESLYLRILQIFHRRFLSGT